MRYKKIIELLPACALLSLLSSANGACSSGQASNKQEKVVVTDTITAFALPTIPTMLNTPELRADYQLHTPSRSDGASMGKLH